MKRWLWAGGALAVLAVAYLAPRLDRSDAAVMQHRLVYIDRGLGNDEHVAEIRDIVERAAKSGYTGVVLASMFDRITTQPPEYFRRLGEVKSACESWGLDIIVSMFTAGYGGGILSHNKNLAAAVPVRDALYYVRDGLARPFQPRRARIANGGFEDARGDRVDSFSFQDAPGTISHLDRDVFAAGKASLRLDSFTRHRNGLARVMQEVDVEPFRTYRVSCWMRSRNLAPTLNVMVQVRTPKGRVLMSWQPDIGKDDDWREVVTGFNSLEYDKVFVYAGIWGGQRGQLWVDDLAIEEAGPVNVLRREGTPVTVKSAASGTVYEEGRDYEPLIDPHLNFRFDHRGPALRITTNSRIRDGDKLRLSYYQGFAINRYQVSICISEPQVYELWRAQLEMVRDVLDPAGYLLAMDEVRAGGWCRTCESDGLDAGERLGHTITRQVAMIDEVDPGSDVLVWSDMLDPNHNAHDDYFLYKGDFGGSWKHIPRGLIITCWYYDKRRASLRHFERLGFRTLAGAYYDADNLEKVKGWIADLEHTRGACGIMYTTWENKYGLLEQFGKLVTSQQSDSSKDG